MTTKKGNVVQNIHLNVLDKPKNNSDGSLIKKKNKKKIRTYSVLLKHSWRVPHLFLNKYITDNKEWTKITIDTVKLKNNK